MTIEYRANLRGGNVSQNIRASIIASSKTAINKTNTETKREMKSKARQKFNVKYNNFINTFTSKVYDQRVDAFPSLMFYNRIFYFKIFTTGGSISKRVLIPFHQDKKRIGRQKFKAIIDNLKATGTAFFRKIRGKLILFAKVTKENSKQLNYLKKSHREKSGIARINRGTIIPIGVVVDSLTLQKRYNFQELIEGFAKESLLKNTRNIRVRNIFS